jgi:hypothetical protein
MHTLVWERGCFEHNIECCLLRAQATVEMS